MRTRILTGLVAAGLVVAAVLGGLATRAEARPAAQQTIVQTAVAAGQFTTLVSLVKQAGLATTLSGKGPYTVFAPTDAAFKKVPKATLTKLGKDKALLRKVLLFHVAKGRVTAAQVVKLRTVPTLAGVKASVQVRGGSVYIDGAKVTKPDVKASNGVIHVVNTVMIP